MEFIYILLGLFFASFIGALLSLRRELSRPKEIKRAKTEFKKEKILYKAH